MKLYKHLAAAICSIALFGLLISSKTSADTKPVTVTVLSTSDVHGSIFAWDYYQGKPSDCGLAKVSTLVKKERANGNVILLDGGDFLQGTPLDSYFSNIETNWDIHPVIKAFNIMGYDAITLGNHEFNFGLQFLQRALSGSKAAILSANTRLDSNGNIWPAAKPWTIKDFNIDGKRLRFGIIGVITPAIPNFESPENFKGLVFTAQAEIVKKSIAELKSIGADSIIVVTHSGVESPRRGSPENNVINLAENCPGIDLIISGHDHSLIDNEHPIMDGDKVRYEKGVVNGVPVISPKHFAEYMGKAVITLSSDEKGWKIKSIATSNVSVKGVEEDRDILTQLTLPHAKTITYLNTIIGTAVEEFPATDGDRKETALVGLINKVQQHYGNSDLSAAPCFNLKAIIHKGDITFQDIYMLYPYENFLCTIRINGDQLRKYLEKSAEYFKQTAPGDPVASSSVPSYNFDAVQGVEYLIDVTKPVGSRITKLIYKGKPVHPNDSFTLSLNNYRFNGGGGYMEAMGFSKDVKPELVWDSQKSLGDNGKVWNLIAAYIKEKKRITPSLDNNWQITTSGD